MTTLDELKSKWFIDVSDTTSFPPRMRHAGSAIRTSTDGNTVQGLRDGDMFMGKWADAVDAMRTGPSPKDCQVWITGWRLEGVETRGHDHPDSDALDMLNAADSAGVQVFGMISRHIPGWPFNSPTLLWLNAHNMWGIAMDNRFPTRGSGHQKFSCLHDPNHRHCLLGSIDISKTRWDTVFHDYHSLQRNPRFGKPTHDTGVLVEGPAVADIEATFQERWDDPTRTLGLQSTLWAAPPLPLLGPPAAEGAVAGGTHSIQVLHTYGRASKFEAYSWSPVGEFTVWASYLNAMKTASKYIYIEDQYFMPFGASPAFLDVAGPRRDSDLFYQLGQAIRRGVKVLALVPSNAEDRFHGFQKNQRDRGVKYLQDIANTHGVTGDFVIISLTNGVGDVYVHSKLMIVDDEVVFCGSANFGRRSMTFDSETQVAIVDSAEQFAAGFRADLWAEHLGVARTTVVDWAAGYAQFKTASTVPRTGHVRPYPYEQPETSSTTSTFVIDMVIDPYGGPPL